MHKPQYKLTGQRLPYIGLKPGLHKRAGTRDELLFVIEQRQAYNIAFVLERRNDSDQINS